MNQKHINPVYAVGAVVLVGGLFASFLWTKAEGISTNFELESRLANIEQASQKEASSVTSKTKSKSGSTATGSGLVGKYDVDGALLVRYTNSGFVPSTVSASLRQVIRFRNDSNGAMRVAPNVVPPSESYYADLAQGTTVGNGGSFDFGINRVGAFPFMNLNTTKHTGLLIVTP